MTFTNSTFLSSNDLAASIHWPCSCLYVYIVIFLWYCSVFWSGSKSMLFVFIGVVGCSIIKTGELLGFLKGSSHFCACPGHFPQWFEVRGGCLFCWYWCNCWLPLFKPSFHNYLLKCFHFYFYFLQVLNAFNKFKIIEEVAHLRLHR